MSRLSSLDRLATQGPPNGDYARYVQTLSNTLAIPKPQATMVQVTSRPVVLARTQPHATTGALATSGAAPSAVGARPLFVPAPTPSPRPSTPARADDEDFDDDIDENDDDDEPLSDEQIEALKRAMAANNESASPAAVNLIRRALTAIGVSLLLWVIFGDGKGFWIVIAIAALLIGSRLRKA